MTTPIRRRFDVVTEILDKVGGKQTLSTPIIVVDSVSPNGKKFNEVGSLDWKQTYSDETKVEYNWLNTLFAQPLRPNKAIVLHRNVSQTAVEALDESIKLGAEFYWVCSECSGAGQSTPDGTTTDVVDATFETKTLPGQSTKSTTVTIVPSVNGTAGTVGNSTFKNNLPPSSVPMA